MKSDSDGYVSEIVVATVEQSVKDYIKDDKYRLLLVRNEVVYLHCCQYAFILIVVSLFSF